jgi:hypothetical protein
MKKILALLLAGGLLVLASPGLAAPTAKEAAAKKALQELHEFVGGWKGTGGPKLNPAKGAPFWEEQVNWGWKFKGDACWMVVEFKGGKFLSKAELKYDPDKKKYVLTGTPVKGTGTLTFTGTFSDDKLTLERIDPDTKETQRFRINTAAEGIRLIYLVDRKAEGATLWKPEFAIQSTKLGESLAKSEKGPECVVSGGRGTSTVSYMGETFYICCSGCAEAFRDNPKKYVDEFKAKKKKK